jgi:hypothetical protein
MSDPARDLRNVARCYAGNSVRPLVGHNDGACADSALSPARKLAFVDHFVSASNTSAIMSGIVGLLSRNKAGSLRPADD